MAACGVKPVVAIVLVFLAGERILLRADILKIFYRIQQYGP